jgi:hypothetical protein
VARYFSTIHLGALVVFFALAIEVCAAQESSTSTDGVPNALAAGEAYSILYEEKYGGRENAFQACVKKRMDELLPDARYVRSRTFRDALFPYFEPHSAPDTVAEFAEMLARPAVQKKIDDLGLRFLIEISGETEYGNQNGYIGAGVSTAGGGCFGVASAQKKSTIAIAIWDLKSIGRSRELAAEASRTATLVCLALPIPLIPATETEACHIAAERLAKLLSGKSSEQPVAPEAQ